MRTEKLVFDEDRLLVELVVKKIAVYLQGLISIGIWACRYQAPSPKDYFAERRDVLHALAVTMRCVHGSTELAYIRSQIEDSSHQIASLLDQLIETYQELVQWKGMERSLLHSLIQRLREQIAQAFTVMNQHLILVGSSKTIDQSIITSCKSIIEAIPTELGDPT
jgi:hypothetical protein